MALESIKEAEKLHNRKIDFSAGTKKMTTEVMAEKTGLTFNDDDFEDAK